MTLHSCQFSKSVEKDLITGAFSSGDGLSSDKVVIEVNGKNDNRNEFTFGEKVNLVFEDVKGFTKTEGKVFPGISIAIVKNEKDTLLGSADLLEDLGNGTELSPLKLNASFTTTFPLKSGDTFKAFVKIYDKKGKGTFSYELPFTVKQNELLQLKNGGLTYSNIYLWDETLKQPVFDKNINANHLYILILDGVEGLEIANEKVYPVFSLDLTDSKGGKIISNENLLSNFEQGGIDAKSLKEQVVAKISFTKGKFDNPCKLTAKLKDKNSAKEILIETELIVN